MPLTELRVAAEAYTVQTANCNYTRGDCTASAGDERNHREIDFLSILLDVAPSHGIRRSFDVLEGNATLPQGQAFT